MQSNIPGHDGLVNTIETDREIARDNPAAEVLEMKDDLASSSYHDPLRVLKTAVDREPDDARKVEALADAILANPLDVLFGLWDAELARGNDAGSDADSELDVEYLFAAYDRRKQARRWREWPRDWQPYCLVRRADNTWTMVGREYKRLGTVQSTSAPWSDWNAPDHVIWQFKCRDPFLLLGGDGENRIWRKPPGFWGPRCLYLPLNEPDYCICVGRLIAATVDPSSYASLVLGRLPLPMPPTPSAPLAA
jgi:hypothetical protein